MKTQLKRILTAIIAIGRIFALPAMAAKGKVGKSAKVGVNFIPALCIVCLTVIITACGGGGGGGGTPVTVPIFVPVLPPTTPSPTMTVVTPDPSVATLSTPNPSDGINYRDAEFSLNWGLGTINADAAYQRGYWGQNVTVGVVDSGVHTSHNDLSLNITEGRAFNSAGDTLMMGRNDDPHGHGTHVAGIIGGYRGNNGIHGVAPSVRIMPLRISDSSGELNGKPAPAFRYAIDNNVKILNNSWGEEAITVRGVYRNSGINFGADTNSHLLRMPWTEAVLALPFTAMASIRNEIASVAFAVEDDDVAVVFSAGNNSWNGSVSRNPLCYGGFDTSGRCHSTNRMLDRYPADIIDNFFFSVVLDNRGPRDILSVAITLSEPFTTTVNGSQTVLNWESSSANSYALAPIWHPTVRSRWLAVVATDQNNTLASFSNGCGEKAKWWCIAAPGVGISSSFHNPMGDIISPRNDDAGARALSGTSQAAPHVSGALALLKSRLPNIPMSVLVHLLLTTATDLGAAGVDDVYGHGLVNISAAITRQGNIILPSSQMQGLLLQHSNTEVPSSFAGFAKRLNGVGVAAEYLDGFYYDHPLGGMVKARSRKDAPLAFAGELFNVDETIDTDGLFSIAQNDKVKVAGFRHGSFSFRHNFHRQPTPLQDKGELNHRPFFAEDDGHSNEMRVSFGSGLQLFAARGEEQKADYSQMGIQWQLSSFPSSPSFPQKRESNTPAGRPHPLSSLGLQLSHSHITEDKTLLGGKFGGIMPLKDGGYIRQTDIGLNYALDKRWKIFANYQRADIDAKFGGIVGDMSGVVADGWRGGFAASNWLRQGDNFRIGIGRETNITRGDMVLHINQSANPQQDESTRAMHHRGYEPQERRISLAQYSPLFFAAGYAFAPTDNSQLAIAINARRHTPSALSIDWRWNF